MTIFAFFAVPAASLRYACKSKIILQSDSCSEESETRFGRKGIALGGVVTVGPPYGHDPRASRMLRKANDRTVGDGDSQVWLLIRISWNHLQPNGNGFLGNRA